MMISDYLKNWRTLLHCMAVVAASAVLLQPVYGQGDGTLKWFFDAGSDVNTAPAIGPEGVIYIGASADLIAVQPDGAEKWRYTTGSRITQPPAIADDGTIYTVSNDGHLHALDPDGTLKWTYIPDVLSLPSSEIALAADGTVYYAVSETLFAINPDGSEFWRALRASGKGLINGLSIGLDGLILAMLNNTVIALDSQGVEQWQFESGGSLRAAAAFGDDGTIYFGNLNQQNNFFALNPDGTLKWQVTVNQVSNSPSTGVNGEIYVPVDLKLTQGRDEGFVISLNSDDGSQNWSYATDGGVGTTPLVGFDGKIYFGNTSNKLIALRSDGTELWVFEPAPLPGAPRANGSPNIAPDGTIYFGSTDDNLYAVRSSSAGLAASSWPKKQRDVRNTGRFGSDITRRQWFAPQVYWLDDVNNAIVTIRHTGGSAGSPAGTTASFRIDVLNRDGSLSFSISDSVEPGQTKDIVLTPPGSLPYAGAALVDASIKDGTVLAPFLTWVLDVSEDLEPLRIGAFFSDPTEAAIVHHFPAEASTTNGLGIAVQNIGENEIGCLLEFFNADGTMQAQENLNLEPRGSIVDFFNTSVPEGFTGSATFSCDAPVVAVAVNQDFANGGFPTDRVTIKGRN